MSSTSTNPPNPATLAADIVRARKLQQWSLCCLLALILWFAIEAAILAPAQLSLLTLVVGWLLHSIALIAFIPGLRAAKARSAVWLAFVLMFYSVFAVLGAFAPGLSGRLAIVEAVLIGLLFFLAIRFVKIKRATQNGAL